MLEICKELGYNFSANNLKRWWVLFAGILAPLTILFILSIILSLPTIIKNKVVRKIIEKM